MVQTHTRILQVPKFKAAEFSYILQSRRANNEANATFWSLCGPLDPSSTDGSQRTGEMSKFTPPPKPS